MKVLGKNEFVRRGVFRRITGFTLVGLTLSEERRRYAAAYD
jgi:hypothetical protein